MEAQDAQIANENALETKLDVKLDLVVDGRPVHIEARVTGEGEAAQRAVDELSHAIARVVSLSASTPLPATQTIAAPAVVQPARAQRAPQPPSPMMVWVQRNRARINITFGAVLVGLALLIPLIVPPAQRSDVLVLTILFTLAGALLLFTAFLPSRSQVTDEPAAVAPTKAAPATSSAARREQLLRPQSKHPGMKTGVGIAVSLVFIVAGLVAPFMLGATNADERFLIMLGFIPISVVGFFMLAVYGRQYFGKLVPAGNAAASKPSTAPAAKRAPVNRVPQSLEYRALVPVAIISSLVLMIVVVIVVIYATVASVAR